MDPTRAEIMAEVVALKALMESVVFWSKVVGWLVVGLLALTAYQIRLKHKENAKTNVGLAAVNAALDELKNVLADVLTVLQLVRVHGELTDKKKKEMGESQAEFAQVSRLQASKVAMIAEKSAAELKKELTKMSDQMPDKVADKVVEKTAAKNAEDSGVMPIPKIAPEGQ